MKQLIGLIAIVAILSVGLSSCKSKAPKKVQKKVAVIKQDTVVPEPIVDVEPVQISKPEKYFLIAGSFSREGNANNFSTKLQGLGYESRIFQSGNGYYRVSYMGFSDKKEALRILADERGKEGSSDVWLHIPR